ncbi:MAG: ThiF family adenylyltransferase [Nitrososphaerota archaeon]
MSAGSELSERYDRQMRISGWNQDLVSGASVLIAGVGALGCEVAKNLALSGVGRIVLVDRDVVELSNLNRQMLFDESDIGRKKAEAGAEKLRAMNPHIRIEAYPSDLRDLPAELFASVDVICSCLDSWGIRRWLNSVAVLNNKPLVDGGIEGMVGNVQVVIPGRTACLECHGTTLIPQEERMAECTLRRRRPEELIEDLKAQGLEISREQAEALFRHNLKTVFDLKYTPPESVPDGEVRSLLESIREKLKPRMPAVQSVSSVIAGIVSTEVLKIIHRGSIGRPMRGLLVYDASNSRFTRVPLKRMENCIVCGQVDASPPEVTLEDGATVYRLKEVIAERFGFPDAEVIHGTRVLGEDAPLSSVLGPSGEGLLYVVTTRRYEPLPIVVKLRAPGDR